MTKFKCPIYNYKDHVDKEELGVFHKSLHINLNHLLFLSSYFYKHDIKTKKLCFFPVKNVNRYITLRTFLKNFIMKPLNR